MICHTCKWIVVEHIEALGSGEGRLLFSTWFCDPDYSGEAQVALGKCERYRTKKDTASDCYGMEEYEQQYTKFTPSPLKPTI